MSDSSFEADRYSNAAYCPKVLPGRAIARRVFARPWRFGIPSVLSKQVTNAMRGIGTATPLLLLAGSLAASAPPQVALVEDVTGKPAGVELMDYVEVGKVIELGADDRIVLGYMSSCMRETITGGTVTVGKDESEVRSGKVTRIKVRCDPGKLLLSTRQGQAAGMAFRSAESAALSVSVTLYGSSPLVELKAPATLRIERVDRPGERQVVDVNDEQILNGRFYDFATRGKHLAAGGVYRMSSGQEAIVFKIDSHAKPGNTPVLGRLLRLPAPE